MKRANIGPVLAVVVAMAGVLSSAAHSAQNEPPAPAPVSPGSLSPGSVIPGRLSPGRLNIAEFEQFLASLDHSLDRSVDHSVHHSVDHPSDKDLAKKLAGFELTERASSARLTQWQQRFTGKRTREVLTAVADLSAFQNPPAAELPSDPPPDLATQREIFSRVVDYVVTTRPRLPDFSARR